MNRRVQGPSAQRQFGEHSRTHRQTQHSSMSISTLRSSLRQRRQALSAEERAQKSLAIAQNLARLPQFPGASSIAFYASMPEEVDTTEAIRLAQESGKGCYLPVINRRGWRAAPLLFHPFIRGETTLVKGKLGIREPAHRSGSGILGRDLDMVCVPLVGFNPDCDRIGMGKAYYDRCFARRGWRQVFLVGLAFACQEAEFTAQAHDVRLDAIVTEAGTFLPGRQPPANNTNIDTTASTTAGKP